MNIKEQLKTLNHHAYCIVGDSTIAREIISILETAHNIREKGNPDFFYQEYTNISIDDTRMIKNSHDTRPVSQDAKKVFIMKTDGMTVEAQNAFLKLLEEPAEYAIFFIIIPSLHLLLSTVKSRLKILESSHSVLDNDIYFKEAEKFIAMKIPDRLEFIKSFTDDISKEKKTKREAIDLVNAIEKNLYDKSTLKENISSFEAIDTARKYMNDRSPSLKMLLEYLAMSV